MPVYFAQDCPTCGRRLHVNLADAHHEVVCQHCLGTFVASDPQELRQPSHDWRTATMKRADELLAQVG